MTQLEIMATPFLILKWTIVFLNNCALIKRFICQRGELDKVKLCASFVRNESFVSPSWYKIFAETTWRMTRDFKGYLRRLLKLRFKEA